MKKTNKERNCAACGADCRRKSVGQKYKSKVICLTCNASGYAGFDRDGNVVKHPEKDWRQPE